MNTRPTYHRTGPAQHATVTVGVHVPVLVDITISGTHRGDPTREWTITEHATGHVHRRGTGTVLASIKRDIQQTLDDLNN